MSKGLEALHHPRIELAKIDISVEGKHDIAYMPFYKTKQYAAIEKELKAFEIIDKHIIKIGGVKGNFTSDNIILVGLKNLTQEDYDLLKGILLWD